MNYIPIQLLSTNKQTGSELDLDVEGLECHGKAFELYSQPWAAVNIFKQQGHEIRFLFQKNLCF